MSEPKPLPVSRREFLRTTTAGLAALSAFPSLAVLADDDPCATLKRISDGWDKVARPMLADQYHRLNHVLFHYVRNNWAGLASDQQRRITDLGWGCPRPSLSRGTWDNQYNALFWDTANYSGEDFLFYHRWMIKMVDDLLTAAGLPRLEAWSGTDAIPSPKRGCPDEFVPEFVPKFEDPETGKLTEVPWLTIRVQEIKSASFYWDKMAWWGHEYRDHAYLRTIPLGVLGSRMELGVHNQMHIRWSAYPSNGWQGLRSEHDFTSKKWNDPGYDTLFDELSSHVTPIFFRLHRWIDNRINDWGEAHGLEQRVNELGFPWFKTSEWVSVDKPWNGAYGLDHVTPEERRKRIEVMQKVGAILYEPKMNEKALRNLSISKRREEREGRIISLRDMIE